jgi:hypothetical protein
MKPSMPRLSESVTAVDVLLKDGALDFFRRRFFDTGIGLLPFRDKRQASRESVALLIIDLLGGLLIRLCPDHTNPAS